MTKSFCPYLNPTNYLNKSLNDILEITNEKTIHQKNLEPLAKELYESVNGLPPQIMNDLFYLEKLLTSTETFSRCIPTIRKLLNLEPTLLQTEGPW